MIVRPKASAPPIMQRWDVLREDPVTHELREYTIVCIKGMLPDTYRSLGLVGGGTHLFDPYEDLWECQLVDEWRDIRY